MNLNSKTGKFNSKGDLTRILIVDDEDQFRLALSKQLSIRGYETFDVSNGEEAVKFVRHKDPKVVILDQKMPGMDGIQTLRELKKIKPELQVIMLTGHGSTDLARITGKYDIFRFLEKPTTIDELVNGIQAALQERVYAMARYEIPDVKKTNIKDWLIGAHNQRPAMIILGFILFALIAFMPTPSRLTELLNMKKTGEIGEPIAGYSEYRKMNNDQTIAEFYAVKAELYNNVKKPDGTVDNVILSIDKVEFRAKVMVGTLIVASLFWATGAVPIGITALLVGTIMIFFGVLTPEAVAKAYAKDSVIFIFGVLTIAMAISKTRLDRRIGILLLGTSNSLFKFVFFFGPLLSVSAAFLSEHALIAFLTPILLIVYMGVIKSMGIEKDKPLILLLFLLPNFCANIGGPGSPAAGGRNAVMLGILSDYGISISFGKWLAMGLPFVPVMALVIGAYFYLAVRSRIKRKDINIAQLVKRETERLGKMTVEEYKAAFVLIILIILWVTMSDKLGMGGPALFCIVLLNILGILRWKDINQIHLDVVALYAAASAMGAGLACTCGALWLADGFVSILPDFFRSGMGLCISTSLIAGILTNFMSDGATVAAIGPITVPMATLSGMSNIKVGLATAFSSSFAHAMIIGTPNNAIVYSLAKDPETGEQLVTMKDFLIHGSVVILLSFLVLWTWVFYGYWSWM